MAVLLSGGLGGPQPLGSLVAAAALPWLALGGLPARGPVCSSRPGLLVGLALPLFALAAALEYQGGAGAGELLLEVCASAGLLLGLAHAAGGAVPRAQVVWLALVVGLPLCVATLAWNDGPGGSLPWLEALARVSPLEWAFDRADGGMRSRWQDVLAPAALVLVLVGLGRRPA